MKHVLISALMASAIALPANATPPAAAQASEPAKVQEERAKQRTETVHRQLSERRQIEEVRKSVTDAEPSKESDR